MSNDKVPHISSMNIELTTACPLRCPQCYCTLEGGKHIPLQTVLTCLQQARKIGVKHVELSGGETMCYPHLYEVIRAANQNQICANVALSGYAFDQKAYDQMIEAGVGGIFVSLNGSTNEINSLTRDGYNLAISALKLLQENKYPNTTINWVMHSNNADDFPNMILLAEKFDVANLVIIGVKPYSSHSLPTIPSADQMRNINRTLQTYTGKVHLVIERCFSPMLALAKDTKLFGNLNVGENKGCCAGRSMLSISVDGFFSPCRHLEYFEKWDTLEEYWQNSEVLKQIRRLENQKQEPCISCKFCNHCRHCLAINTKLTGKLFIGNDFCPLKSEYKLLTVAEQ